MTDQHRAGLLPAGGMQGQGLLDPRADRSSTLIEGYLPSLESINGILTPVTEKGRITICDFIDWNQLSDLDADPAEMNNLWNDPDYANVKGELALRMTQRVSAYGDLAIAQTSLS